MTQRRLCPPAPGPLEDYAAQFDDVFASLAQRRGFRAYLEGLLLPRDRNKTLTALAGVEPIVGAQLPSVQRLQWYLAESTWDADAVNTRRLELLLTDPSTQPHEQGVLIIDDTGIRKDGTKTAHVARQYLGSLGKVDNGLVAVSSVWADERIYYPLHVQPYEPASRLPKGKQDPAFQTKPQIAVALIDAALDLGVPFRAIVADCIYGEHQDFIGALAAEGLPYVVGLKPSHGIWAPAEAAHTPKEAAADLAWDGPEQPGDWTKVVRRFRDGHEEVWWAADLCFGPYGPDKPVRVVVATTDPATLPDLTTWYLATRLPRPGSPRATEDLLPPADLTEVVRLYGLRNWVEQSYKQPKQELGFGDFQVREDQAIRRHWQLVSCAFSFCWHNWFKQDAATRGEALAEQPVGAWAQQPAESAAVEDGGKKGARRGDRGGRKRGPSGRLLAGDAPARPGLAGSLDVSLALLAGVVRRAPAATTPGLARFSPEG